MKKMYHAPLLECVALSNADVIVTSILVGEDRDADGKFGSVSSIRNRA